MSVMERHVTVWQSVSALAALYDRFVINLKKIEDHLLVTQQDLDALKAKIPELKTQLLERLHAVSGALGVYASEEGDRKLLKLADSKRSDLRKLKSAALIKQAEKLYQAGKKLNEKDIRDLKKPPKFHISGYGLNEKHLQDLREALEKYRQALQEFTEAKASVRKSKAKLAQKIQENNQLLSRRIDRVVLLFKEINPDFFDSYARARKPSTDAGKGPSAGKSKKSSSKTKTSSSKSKKSSGKGGPSAGKNADAAGEKPPPVKTATATEKAQVSKKAPAAKQSPVSKKAPAAQKVPAAKQSPSTGKKPAVVKKPAASVKKPAPAPKPAATGTQPPSSGES